MPNSKKLVFTSINEFLTIYNETGILYEGWAIGGGGVILHTNNGDEDWHEQQSHTEQSLLDVYFVNSQTGWGVGTSGLILHTTDGGANWKP